MKTSRRAEDIARRLLSRKAIPLEERLYLPIALGAVVVFMMVLLVSAVLDVDFEGQRDDQIATSHVDNWALRREVADGNVHLAWTSTSFPEPEAYGVVSETGALSKRFRGRNHAFLDTASGRKVILIRHPLLLGEGQLLVVPAEDVPQLRPPNSSEQTRQALVLALGLVCYLIVVRLLLRRYVFEKVSLLAQVVYARKVFSVTGGIPYDTHGNPLDGLWHVRTWISERLERMGRLGMLLGRRLQKQALKERTRQERGLKEAPSRQGQHASTTRTLPGAKGRKVLIERVSEPPHVPIERFSNDELGQLALALEEGIIRLARYENQLFGAFQTVPMPTWIFDSQGQIVFLNTLAKESTATEPRTLDDLFEVPRQNSAAGKELVERCLAVAAGSHPRFTRNNVKGFGGGLRVCSLPAHGRMYGVLMEMPEQSRQTEQPGPSEQHEHTRLQRAG